MIRIERRDLKRCEFCHRSMVVTQKDTVCYICDEKMKQADKLFKEKNKPKKRNCKACRRTISGPNHFYCRHCHSLMDSGGYDYHVIRFGK